MWTTQERGANSGGRDLRPLFLLPAPDLALDAPRTLSKRSPVLRAPHPLPRVPARVRRALVPYHACMHHGPANKLHRVATLLPLSLSCQVEPLKHSPPPPPPHAPPPPPLPPHAPTPSFPPSTPLPACHRLPPTSNTSALVGGRGSDRPLLRRHPPPSQLPLLPIYPSCIHPRQTSFLLLSQLLSPPPTQTRESCPAKALWGFFGRHYSVNLFIYVAPLKALSGTSEK